MPKFSWDAMADAMQAPDQMAQSLAGTAAAPASRAMVEGAKGLLFDPDAPTYKDMTTAAMGAFSDSPEAMEAKDKVGRHSLALAMGTMQAGPKAKASKALPMDEASRMARAKKMGFDPETTYYHGTKADISEFQKSKRPLDAVYLAETPETANIYAADRAYGASTGGNNVIPVNTSVKKTWDYNNYKDVDQLINEIKSSGGRQYYPEDFSHGGELGKGNWRLIETPEVVSALKKLGFDSAKISEDGARNLAVFEPSQIRSKFAAFDPKKKDSGNLSAALAGAAALGAAASSGGEAQAADTILMEGPDKKVRSIPRHLKGEAIAAGGKVVK